MATCPRCGRFFDDHHHCAGLWRLRLRAWRALLIGGVVGVVAGWLLLDAVVGQASWLSLAVAAFIGIMFVSALQRM